MKRLAIITTHPIQYNAPFFRLLHERGQIRVIIFYTWSQSESGKKFDPGFRQDVEWDIPLLEGYPYRFVKNISTEPGSHHFKGIDNPSLIKEIEDWKADAVLIYGWSFRSHYKAVRYFKKKIPVLFRGDSTLLDQSSFYKQLIRGLVLKYIYKNIDRALYAGTANKAYFLKYGVKEQQLVFMPHAIENNRFKKNDIYLQKANRLRIENDIPLNATVFLFAGKLEQKKQPHVLAEIFASLKNDKVYLLIAGNGPLYDELFLKYGTHKNIRLIGFQNQQQMPVLYASCDIFVLPSKGPNETWGLAINEAMAAGKAIIASNACGASFDLVTEANGFIFEIQHPDGLRKAMNYFEENHEAAGIMGAHSEKIIQQYSFEKDCEAVEKTVNSI